jgi:predicted ATP-grasp superfamily ATP-dependent carboligase
MKKVYFPRKAEHVRLVSEMIFKSGYRGKILLQKRIWGEGRREPRASVLTTYSNRRGKVIRAVLGDVLIEERGATSVGNYSAIVTRPLSPMCYELIELLDSLCYTGVANFDILEGAEGSFCLEANPRQGRSSDYLRGAGVNLAELLLADMRGEELPKVFVYPEILWSAIPPSVAIAMVKDSSLKRRADRIYKEKGYFSPYRIPEDNRLLRKLYVFLHQARQVKRLEGRL